MESSTEISTGVALFRGLVRVSRPWRSILCLAILWVFMSYSSRAQSGRYVCPPCGAPCDTLVFDKPGSCPACGMKLVDRDELKAAAEAAGPATKVAVLIFDGVQIIDFTGPYEMFGAAGFDVYTVAEKKGQVTTSMGMTVIPKYSFADAPQPDILVVPGGGVNATQRNETILKWIRDRTAQTRNTMSVCNGAFILASAGLLDGLAATTTSGNIERLKSTYPKVKVLDDQRFVDNGKIITTAGLTAGIDGALHVVSLIKGEGYAQQVALGEEYGWNPQGGFVRAALPDRLYLSSIDPALDAAGKWNVVRTEGGMDRWTMVLSGTSAMSASELMDRLSRNFAAKAKWRRVKATGSPSTPTSDWRFTGRDGKRWAGTVSVEAVRGDSHGYTVKLNISRAG